MHYSNPRKSINKLGSNVKCPHPLSESQLDMVVNQTLHNMIVACLGGCCQEERKAREVYVWVLRGPHGWRRFGENNTNV